MDALKVILTRRSVRKFTPQSVPEDVINNILNAAMSAPSAANEQPWQFLVINNRKLLDSIVMAHPHALMCQQAPAAILVCIDTSKEKYREFWVQDLSAATQNILLAIRTLGLGGVWLGIYPTKERVQAIKSLFELPESVIPFSLVPFGYTDAAQQEVRERFKKERIHMNKWGE
jgi:nitroreductase